MYLGRDQKGGGNTKMQVHETGVLINVYPYKQLIVIADTEQWAS